MIGDILRRAEIPVVVAGVYEKGVGGEVYLIKPDEGPCYSCFNTYLGKTIEAETVLERKNVYGIPADQVQSVPALAIDINRIATFAADFTMKVLLNDQIHDDKRANLVIFS